jgi:hypothetical protein
MNADKFRELALRLPGAVESSHMDHPDFRIGGKVFASLGFPDDAWGMVKLTPDEQQSFVAADPKSFCPCNGAWGKRGCTNVRLASAKMSMVQASLELASENVAAAKAKSVKPARPRKSDSRSSRSSTQRRRKSGRG